MTVCDECGSIEPNIRDATDEELTAEGFAPDQDRGIKICLECGAIDQFSHYSEDQDMER